MGRQESASNEGLQDGPLMNGDVPSDARSEGAASALPPVLLTGAFQPLLRHLSPLKRRPPCGAHVMGEQPCTGAACSRPLRSSCE